MQQLGLFDTLRRPADQADGGYHVGAKWGRFAETKADALFYAACEIESRLNEQCCGRASHRK